MSDIISIEKLRQLATGALINANTSPENARVVAEALVAADADGLSSHGVSRIPFYADQALSGKVNGQATPQLHITAAAAIRVDAKDGFAFPAIKLGLERGLALVAETGVVGVAIANSHHCGALGYHVEQVAARGHIALGFSNTPSAMAPWGGHKGTFGTNPIAFASLRRNHAPLVIDLSLSKVARGKIMVAQQKGEPIPAGWALDAQGKATTDANAAMAGTMVPLGDAKGAALALMVEILTAALTGAHFAYQASSFFTAEGPPPRIGQYFILINPSAFAGEGFLARIEQLLGEILAQESARLPGDRRLAQREQSRKQGINVPPALHAELQRRAGV
jgi:(2R)-3-sulfolactate dehydrogenase (NADP+)